MFGLNQISTLSFYYHYEQQFELNRKLNIGEIEVKLFLTLKKAIVFFVIVNLI